MFDSIDIYLFVGLLIAFACGLESRLAGRGLAIASHVIAAVVGYYGLAASDLAGLPAEDFTSKAVYVFAALLLCCAWASEMDTLRSEEREARSDGANHMIAFAVGLACAMRADMLIIVGCGEMFALLLRRARANGEAVYSDARG